MSRPTGPSWRGVGLTFVVGGIALAVWRSPGQCLTNTCVSQDVSPAALAFWAIVGVLGALALACVAALLSDGTLRGHRGGGNGGQRRKPIEPYDPTPQPTNSPTADADLAAAYLQGSADAMAAMRETVR